MENFLLLLGIGGFIVFIILRFDRSQRNRVNVLATTTSKLEPLFLKQSAEQKLFTLKTAMSGFESILSSTHVSPQGEESYHKIEAKLEQLVTDYNSGALPLNVYCTRLESLITTVQRLKKDLVSSAA